LRNTKAGSGTHSPQAIISLRPERRREGRDTDPKEGATGISQVARCVSERAKQWKLPKRGMAGSTRIKLTYNLAPRKAA
jgi:hypothetical protein